MAHIGQARIPRKVVLPFGYIITVKQLSNGDFNRRDHGSDGLWEVDRRTIYIRKSLPLNRKRYILLHELGHAWLDFQHHHIDDGRASAE